MSDFFVSVRVLAVGSTRVPCTLLLPYHSRLQIHIHNARMQTRTTADTHARSSCHMLARTRTHEKKKKANAKPESKRWWIEVVEILDPDLPRRLADKPNVKVSIRVSQPTTDNVQTHFEKEKVLFRADLSPTKSYSDHELAKKRQAEVRERLMAQGYTVNKNLSTWSPGSRRHC